MAFNIDCRNAVMENSVVEMILTFFPYRRFHCINVPVCEKINHTWGKGL